MGRYFRGHAHHKLDQKGRVSLPSDFRDVLRDQDTADRFVLIPCLPGETWHTGMSVLAHDRLIERIAGRDLSKAQKRHLQHIYVARSRPISLEDGGRFVLSPAEREALGLSGHVRFVGTGDVFEIWQPEAYDAIFAGGDGDEAAPELDLSGLML